MAQTAARQGGARARSRHAGALKDHQGKRGRVSQLCRSLQHTPDLQPPLTVASPLLPAITNFLFANAGSVPPLLFLMIRRPPRSTRCPYTTLFRSLVRSPVELSEVGGRRQHDGPNRSPARGRSSSLAPRWGSERSSGKKGPR